MLLSGLALSLVLLISRLSLVYFPLILLIFLRFAIPTFLLFAILVLKERKMLFQSFRFKKEDGLKVLRALLVVGAQLSILFYLKIGTVLDATVLLNTGPLFIPLLEWLFLKHKIGKSTIVAMIVSAVGVFLILRPEITIFRLASIIGLLGGILQAGSQILFGIYAKHETGLLPLFRLFFLCTVISFITLLFFPSEYLPFCHNCTQAWAFMSALAIFTLLNQWFRSRAYFYGKPSTLACFFYSSIIFAMIFDWLFFDNAPTVLSYVGAGLVILGGILKIYLRHIILKRRGK